MPIQGEELHNIPLPRLCDSHGFGPTGGHPLAPPASERTEVERVKIKIRALNEGLHDFLTTLVHHVLKITALRIGVGGRRPSPRAIHRTCNRCEAPDPAFTRGPAVASRVWQTHGSRSPGIFLIGRSASPADSHQGSWTTSNEDHVARSGSLGGLHSHDIDIETGLPQSTLKSRVLASRPHRQDAAGTKSIVAGTESS